MHGRSRHGVFLAETYPFVTPRDTTWSRQSRCRLNDESSDCLNKSIDCLEFLNGECADTAYILLLCQQEDVNRTGQRRAVPAWDAEHFGNGRALQFLVGLFVQAFPVVDSSAVQWDELNS